jgi:hypothetical protein
MNDFFDLSRLPPSTRDQVITEVLLDPNTSEDLFDTIIYSGWLGSISVGKQTRLLLDVAERSSNPEVLAQLAQNENRNIRWAVAENRFTPTSVLESFFADPDCNVAGRATILLKKRQRALLG